jgi:tetratricopeptide (TPR) repeat protein
VSCMAAFYLLGAGISASSWVQAPDPDALYADRERLASATQAADLLQAQLAEHADYAVAWKLARISYWLGTQGPDAGRRRSLDRGVKAGETATRLESGRPEGHFWLAANMGALAEFHGLLQGIKYRGRIKDELEAVLRIDPAWQYGSADRALGWWYFKVPGLFGGSRTKAREHLERALARHPESPVTLYFLAELAVADRRRDDARRLFEQAIAAPLDPDFAPEDRVYKRRAESRLRDLFGTPSGAQYL